MKIIAAILLVMGVLLGLVIPYLWGNYVSGAGAQLPQFIWSKSPPRTFHLSATALLRVIGLFLTTLSILCFILFRRTDGK